MAPNILSISSSKVLVNGARNDVLETIQTKNERKEKPNKSQNELPNWIAGEVKKFDKDDLFVTEYQSFTRIVLILFVISTCEIFLATTFVVLCINLSKTVIADKEWDIPIESKYSKSQSD